MRLNPITELLLYRTTWIRHKTQYTIINREDFTSLYVMWYRRPHVLIGYGKPDKRFIPEEPIHQIANGYRSAFSTVDLDTRVDIIGYTLFGEVVERLGY